MATTSGRTDRSITKELAQEPHKFGFFQAIRLLEKLYKDRSPIGTDTLPENEVVALQSKSLLSFPASEIFQLTNETDLTNEDDGSQPKMTVNFMGMAGLMGMLPMPYTELLQECKQRNDFAFSAFLDIFNHRLISLHYRAWEKYRFAIAFERDGGEIFTRSIYSLMGLGTRGLEQKMSIPDKALLYYSGLLSQRPHSASALIAILRGYFQVDVNIVQFVGQWLKLDEESLTTLGEANCELGVDTILGTQIWNSQSKFRLQFGPLKFNEFQQLLPTGTAYQQVCDLVQFYVGLELDFDIQLYLEAEEVPDLILTSDTDKSALLGWTTWLKTEPFTSPDGQVILTT